MALVPTSTAYRPNVADRPSEVADRPDVADRPVKRLPLTGRLFSLTGMVQCNVADRPYVADQPLVADRPDKRFPLSGMVQCDVPDRPYVADRPSEVVDRPIEVADRPLVADRPDKRFPLTGRLFSLTGIFQNRFPAFSLLALLRLLFLHTRHCCCCYCCCCCSKPLKPNLQLNICIFSTITLPTEVLSSKSRNLYFVRTSLYSLQTGGNVAVRFTDKRSDGV